MIAVVVVEVVVDVVVEVVVDVVVEVVVVDVVVVEQGSNNDVTTNITQYSFDCTNSLDYRNKKRALTITGIKDNITPCKRPHTVVVTHFDLPAVSK